MSRPWTLTGLAAVYALAQSGAELGEIAEAVGRLSGEVDLALWVLIGRTPPEAVERLNSRPAPSSQLASFLAETLP